MRPWHPVRVNPLEMPRALVPKAGERKGKINTTLDTARDKDTAFYHQKL